VLPDRVQDVLAYGIEWPSYVLSRGVESVCLSASFSLRDEVWECGVKSMAVTCLSGHREVRPGLYSCHWGSGSLKESLDYQKQIDCRTFIIYTPLFMVAQWPHSKKVHGLSPSLYVLPVSVWDCSRRGLDLLCVCVSVLGWVRKDILHKTCLKSTCVWIILMKRTLQMSGTNATVQNFGCSTFFFFLNVCENN